MFSYRWILELARSNRAGLIRSSSSSKGVSAAPKITSSIRRPRSQSNSIVGGLGRGGSSAGRDEQPPGTISVTPMKRQRRNSGADS